MRNAKRKIGLLLILCMFVSMLPASVCADGSGVETSPVPSENGADFIEITREKLADSTAKDVPTPLADDPGYSFDSKTGTLTLTTEVPDFSKEDNPWKSVGEIKSLVINPGVTGVTKDTFNGLYNLSNDVSQPYAVTFNGIKNEWKSVGTACNENGLQIGDKYFIVALNDGKLFGKCGEDVYFDFDGNGELKITGSGTKIADLGEKKENSTIFENGFDKAPWYSVRDKITSLIIPENITEIGAFAFYHCTGLETIEISEKVTSIGDYAFAKCAKLKDLTIKGGNTSLSIGKYAFWECKALTNLGSADKTGSKTGLPKRVTSIGQAAFRTSGLQYNGRNDIGHIYYEGNKDEWLKIGENNSPEIRDGRLLTGAVNGDESTYAIVHYTDANATNLYYKLTFGGGPGASGQIDDLSKLDIVSTIVSLAVKDQTVAADTIFKLPAQGVIARPGFSFTGWLCSADNKIYQIGDEFTMPKKDVSFTAQWKVDVPAADSNFGKFIEAFADAENAGRSDYIWTVLQEAVSSEKELIPLLYDITAKRVTQIAGSNAIQETNLSYRIQVKSFTPAMTGISNMTAGQNGRFAFDVHFTLSDNGKKIYSTASIKDGVITATRYVAGKTDITYTVTFDPGEGKSDIQENPKSYYAGTTFLLPACKFTPPDKKKFTGWKCKIDDVYQIIPDAKALEKLNYQENSKFTMRPAKVTFTAQWSAIPPASSTTTVSTRAKMVTRQGALQPAAVQNLDALISGVENASIVLEAAPVAASSPDAARLRTAAAGSEMTLVDLTIYKTVNGQTSAVTDTNGTLVGITLPFDGKDAENVEVLRCHEGQVDVLSEGVAGEHIERNSDNLTLYAGKFSVYAIVFDRKTSASGGDSTGGSSNGGNSSGSSGSSGSSSSGGSSGGRSKPNIRDNGASGSNPAPSPSGGDTSSKRRFDDVLPGAWYYEAATWAYDAKIAKGEGGRRFNPNKLCTRAEMLTFLWRALGSPEPSGTGKVFTDVPSGAYYTKAVQWAAGQKIVKGEGGKRFNPNATVTRAEAVTFLSRALGGTSLAAARFTDVPASAYYAGAVAWASEQGIAQGMGKRSFQPSAPCTRAQVLTFLYRSQS